MVPGQDPDLRAPTSRAACLREISVQLEAVTDGKRNETILVRLSTDVCPCSLEVELQFLARLSRDKFERDGTAVVWSRVTISPRTRLGPFDSLACHRFLVMYKCPHRLLEDEERWVDLRTSTRTRPPTAFPESSTVQQAT